MNLMFQLTLRQCSLENLLQIYLGISAARVHLVIKAKASPGIPLGRFIWNFNSNICNISSRNTSKCFSIISGKNTTRLHPTVPSQKVIVFQAVPSPAHQKFPARMLLEKPLDVFQEFSRSSRIFSKIYSGSFLRICQVKNNCRSYFQRNNRKNPWWYSFKN